MMNVGLSVDLIMSATVLHCVKSDVQPHRMNGHPDPEAGEAKITSRDQHASGGATSTLKLTNQAT